MEALIVAKWLEDMVEEVGYLIDLLNYHIVFGYSTELEGVVIVIPPEEQISFLLFNVHSLV